MRVTHLSLNNFRNYGRLELALTPGATLLYGDNAQGKTNLLEAIYYLATTRSPHATQDNQLIYWEASQSSDPLSASRLVADLATSGPDRQVEMRLILERRDQQSSFRREALLNRRKVRLMDLLGQMQVVLFLPEDVALVTGAPGARRRYLDITLCQVDRHYCRSLSQYNKVLEQRNAVLRQIGEGAGNQDVLEIMSDRLVEFGQQIFARRAAFFSAIEHDIQRIHFEELTAGREALQINYLPRLRLKANGSNGQEQQLEDADWLMTHQEDSAAIGRRFAENLDALKSHDILRGSTSIGPHRDDWRFSVNIRDLSIYGSRGQQRSAILALKMTQIDWMTNLTGESPILLLDEVVAELDEIRREKLLRYVQRAEQAILTATDPGMFSKEFINLATRLEVKQGSIHKADSPANGQRFQRDL